MRFSFFQKIWLVNLILAILFILDRLLKGSPHSFQNPYIAFGIPLGGRWLTFIIAIILILLVVGLIRAFRARSIWQVSSLALMIFGALSNLIDRLLFGFVIDYISIGTLSNFNLADAMIVSGAILIAFKFLFRSGFKS